MGGANGDGNGNAAGGKAAGSKAQAAAATAQKRAAAGEEVALGDAKQAKQQKVADQQRKSDAPASAVSDAGVRVERLSYPVQLSAVYDESDAQSFTATQARFQNLCQTFHKIYGRSPQAVARAPGRVNLIGEHIDYEGYSVLPMAISLDTLVAIAPCDTHNEVVVHNVSPQYQAGRFAADPSIQVGDGSVQPPIVPSNVPDALMQIPFWIRYVQCGYKGIFDFVASKAKEAKQTKEGGSEDKAALTMPERKGLHVLVDGKVPLGSGLSSSSALVCAASIAIMEAHGLSLAKEDVAELARVCERYIGVISGGMDQAISVMADRGSAKLIRFNPVRGTKVKLPKEATFVIANSIVESRKAETASGKYNLRVLECMLASFVLAKAIGVPHDKALEVTTLKQVEDLVPGEDIVYLAKQHLKAGKYTGPMVEELLGVTLEEHFKDNDALLKSIAFARGGDGEGGGEGGKKVKEGPGFHLQARALHVYTEAKRVDTFVSICKDAKAAPMDKLLRLGKLMRESHKSCRELYDCSSPELDELVELSEGIDGQLGARLTGAGWGGCIVAYVLEKDVNAFIERMYEGYYKKKVDQGIIERSRLPNCIFPSKPLSGACVFVFDATNPQQQQ